MTITEIVPADEATTTTAEPIGQPDEPTGDDAGLIEDELLVEEISIDGMCGVY
jgi:mycofactocin precursor